MVPLCFAELVPCESHLVRYGLARVVGLRAAPLASVLVVAGSGLGALGVPLVLVEPSGRAPALEGPTSLVLVVLAGPVPVGVEMVVPGAWSVPLAWWLVVVNGGGTRAGAVDFAGLNAGLVDGAGVLLDLDAKNLGPLGEKRELAASLAAGIVGLAAGGGDRVGAGVVGLRAGAGLVVGVPVLPLALAAALCASTAFPP